MAVVASIYIYIATCSGTRVAVAQCTTVDTHIPSPYCCRKRGVVCVNENVIERIYNAPCSSLLCWAEWNSAEAVVVALVTWVVAKFFLEDFYTFRMLFFCVVVQSTHFVCHRLVFFCERSQSDKDSRGIG